MRGTNVHPFLESTELLAASRVRDDALAAIRYLTWAVARESRLIATTRADLVLAQAAIATAMAELDRVDALKAQMEAVK